MLRFVPLYIIWTISSPITPDMSCVDGRQVGRRLIRHKPCLLLIALSPLVMCAWFSSDERRSQNRWMLASEYPNHLYTDTGRILCAAVRLYCILFSPTSSPPSSLCSDGDRKQVSGKWSCTKPTTASHYPLNSTRLITMTMTDGLLLDHWDGTQGRDRNMQVQNTDSTAATLMLYLLSLHS